MKKLFLIAFLFSVQICAAAGATEPTFVDQVEALARSIKTDAANLDQLMVDIQGLRKMALDIERQQQEILRLTEDTHRLSMHALLKHAWSCAVIGLVDEVDKTLVGLKKMGEDYGLDPATVGLTQVEEDNLRTFAKQRAMSVTEEVRSTYNHLTMIEWSLERRFRESKE